VTSQRCCIVSTLPLDPAFKLEHVIAIETSILDMMLVVAVQTPRALSDVEPSRLDSCMMLVVATRTASALRHAEPSPPDNLAQ
jgi:hypothetical protein